MRQQHLRGRKRPGRRPRTTDSRHTGPIAENRLPCAPRPSGPNQIWLTDITYLRTVEGWVYLSAILDAWSRRIVGWACAPTLHASLVLVAFKRALRGRRPPPGLLHHSDRGTQYVDTQYLAVLAAAGCERSMSRAGNCYDNATMESFWSTLKTESGLEESAAQIVFTDAARKAAKLCRHASITGWLYTSTRFAAHQIGPHCDSS